MAVEIERKFKILGIKDVIKMSSGCHAISQGYLSRDPERTVRIRTVGHNGKNRGFITVKGLKENASSLEFEYEIPINDASEMLWLCPPPIIRKNRYVVEFDGMVWEVDEFLDRDLVIAEVELPHVDHQFKLPPWVLRDVTDDPQYFNANMT